MGLICFGKQDVTPIDSQNVNSEFVNVDLNVNIHVTLFNKRQKIDFDTQETQNARTQNASIISVQPRKSLTLSLTSFNGFNQKNEIKHHQKIPQKYHALFKNFDTNKFLFKFIRDHLKSCVLLQRVTNRPFGELSTRSNLNLPTLFFIHGVAGCSQIWSNQVNYLLLKGYEIIVPEIVGHGKSTKSEHAENYEFKAIASHLLRVFDEYCKQDNILIGHSYGCLFATYIGKMRPNLVSKTILISGGSPYPLDYKSLLLDLPLCLMRCLKPFVECHFCCSAFNRTSNYCIHSNTSFNVPIDILQNTMRGQHFLEADVKYHATISQKVLLIESSNDDLVPLDESLDLFRIVKDSYFILINGGSHMSILEDPTIINDIIEKFISMD